MFLKDLSPFHCGIHNINTSNIKNIIVLLHGFNLHARGNTSSKTQ